MWLENGIVTARKCPNENERRNGASSVMPGDAVNGSNLKSMVFLKIVVIVLVALMMKRRLKNGKLAGHFTRK